MGKPDAVFEMPNAFEVPPSGTIEYQYIVIPTGFTEDKWVVQAEARPGNRAVMNTKFVIPPGEPNLKWTPRSPCRKKRGRFDLMPHMHLRGKDFVYRLVYPTGESETVLNVPRFDFNWQLFYFLDQPKVLKEPASSVRPILTTPPTTPAIRIRPWKCAEAIRAGRR